MSLTPPDDGKYTVREGEWVGSIAASYGYNDWNGDVWQRSENDDLRKTRPDPRELAPGDILFIPPRDKKDEDRNSAATHPFKIPVPNDVFRLRILDDNKLPLKNEQYTLELTYDDGAGTYVPSNNPTDGDGILTETVPATTTAGVLYLPRLKQTIKLRFSYLRPIDPNFDPTATPLDPVTQKGIQQRLFNLGFNPGDIDGLTSDTTNGALLAFQQFCKDNLKSDTPDPDVSDAGDVNGDSSSQTLAALTKFYGRLIRILAMAATKDARIVTAMINDNGSLNEVHDPDFTYKLPLLGIPVSWDPDTDIEEPLKEHYGWDLSDQIKTKKEVVLGPIYPTSIEVTINDPDNTKHHNTLAAGKHELVKLDCGYWGSYNRDPKDHVADQGFPQRNFGLIQGHDVWLCNFRENGAASDNQYAPRKDSPAGKLLENIENAGCGIKFISHAFATSTPFTAGLDPKALYVILPDLHLPEKFPDAPDLSTRHPDKDTRKELRNLLRKSQHQDGFIAGNPFGEAYQLLVQPYLESAAKGSAPDFKFPSGFLNTSSSTVTAAQFQAEKDVLDRTIRSRSAWFYGPLSGNSETTDHQDPDDPALIDPAPAVDLGIFLANVIALQQANVTVKLYQLGDLYELWMGREFLYRNFPVNYNPSFWKAMAVLEGLQAPGVGVNDELQYRMATQWIDDSTVDENFTQAVSNELDSLTGSSAPATPHPAARYVYHKWSKFRLLHRHQTGWHYFKDGSISDDMIKADSLADTVTRVKSMLSDRGSAVEAFALPVPDNCPNINTLKTALTGIGLSFDSFQSATDAKQILWHKIIFTCLQTANFENIHGNHDGYRSDPLINDSIGITSQEWISLPGLWLEHGHRWDEFNRDGNAIGAGVTNLVYYYNLKMIDMDRSSPIKQALPGEQKSVIPGAALWYSLVNIAQYPFTSRDGASKVLPFGIMAVGHTHVPDLVRIQYKKEESAPAPSPDDYSSILSSAK